MQEKEGKEMDQQRHEDSTKEGEEQEEGCRTRKLQCIRQQSSIPKQTLSDSLRKVTYDAKAGRPTILPLQEESEIVETCCLFAEWGLGLDKEDVLPVIDFLQGQKAKIPIPQWCFMRGLVAGIPETTPRGHKKEASATTDCKGLSINKGCGGALVL